MTKPLPPPDGAVGSPGTPLVPDPSDQTLPAIDDKRQWRLGFTVAAWLTLGTVVAAAFFLGFGRLVSGDWYPWDNKTKPDLYDLSRSTIAMTGLLGAAIAAGIATRRQRSQERSVDIARRTHHLAAETYAFELQRAAADATRSLRERYGAAAEQLGADAPAVRLAGVYAMAALADDWLEGEHNQLEARSCIEVLSGYLRTPRPGSEGFSDSELAAEREVRRTIVRVIVSHLQVEARPSWSWSDFDFSGSTFVGDTSFAGSKFDGRATFADVTFEGRTVSFERTRFSKSTTPQSKLSFEGAVFKCETAMFSSCVMERPLAFSSVSVMDARIVFNNAEFLAEAKFSDLAMLPSGSLSLKGIEVHPHAKVVARNLAISGTPSFDGAIVRGGSIWFDDCEITGRLALTGITLTDGGSVVLTATNSLGADGLIDVRQSTLHSGRVLVEGMETFEGTVDVTGTEFVGGQLQVHASFAQSQVVGPWDHLDGDWPASPKHADRSSSEET